MSDVSVELDIERKLHTAASKQIAYLVADNKRLKGFLATESKAREGREVLLRENEWLRGLLREAQNYVIDVSDGSTPYAKAAESCWQRIDTALAGEKS